MTADHVKRYGNSTPFLLIGSAYVALLFPSSIDGVIVPVLQTLQCIILASFFLIYGSINGFIKQNIALGVAIVFLLVIFTLFSPFDYVAIGGVAPYILMLSMLSTRIVMNKSMWNKFATNLLIINVMIFALGFGVLAGIEPLVWIIEKFYKAYDENLYESMIVWYSKPVGVFASHSIAAVAYFSLFLININLSCCGVASKSIRSAFLVSGFLYLILLLFLFSNSSVILFVVSVAYLLYFFARKSKKTAIVLLMLSLVVCTCLVLGGVLSDSYNQISEIFTYDAGGFLGRYTEGGRLQSTYDFIIDNPFRPIGLTYGDNIMLGDNFIAEYIVKISFLGYLLILLMLYNWIRLNGRRLLFISFAFFIAVDLGYPILTTVRLSGVLPFYFLGIYLATISVNKITKTSLR